MEKTFKNYISVDGNLVDKAQPRVNGQTGKQFWSARVAVNKGKNPEDVKFYSFTVNSEGLARYLVRGKYVAVSGDLDTKPNGEFNNLVINNSTVLLLRQPKRQGEILEGGYTLDKAIADKQAEVEDVEDSEVDSDCPF